MKLTEKEKGEFNTLCLRSEDMSEDARKLMTDVLRFALRLERAGKIDGSWEESLSTAAMAAEGMRFLLNRIWIDWTQQWYDEEGGPEWVV